MRPISHRQQAETNNGLIKTDVFDHSMIEVSMGRKLFGFNIGTFPNFTQDLEYMNLKFNSVYEP